MYNSLVGVFSSFMAAIIVKLLKNSLLLNKIIDYMTYWYVFAIPSEKEVILHIEFQNLFFKCIELFGINLS